MTAAYDVTPQSEVLRRQSNLLVPQGKETSMSESEWPPSWWKDFPPDWMKADTETVLSLIVAGVLFTREGVVNDYGWIKHDLGPAEPISDDQSSTTHILVERGYVTWAESFTLTGESGESFTAALMVLTVAGSELYRRLNLRK